VSAASRRTPYDHPARARIPQSRQFVKRLGWLPPAFRDETWLQQLKGLSQASFNARLINGPGLSVTIRNGLVYRSIQRPEVEPAEQAVPMPAMVEPGASPSPASGYTTSPRLPRESPRPRTSSFSPSIQAAASPSSALSIARAARRCSSRSAAACGGGSRGNFRNGRYTCVQRDSF
jgi:hypothetical protein